MGFGAKVNDGGGVRSTLLCAHVKGALNQVHIQLTVIYRE